jgi:two-component system sensor histidine kinase KdpD
MPLDRMTELLLSATVKDSVTYVEDVEGQVVAASTMSEDLQQGMSGAVPPGRRFRTVAEMAAAARPEVLEPATREVPAAQCTVYTLSPVSTVLAPTNYLTMRLSVLLLPILAMYSVGVWHRLRTVRLAEAEARARAAEADALRPTEKAKSDFLADASHSLRTPLASMHVSLSGLLDEAVKWSPEELRATLEILDRETYRLSAQVRNLLDMSRLQAEVAGLCREPCDLTALVSSALERVEPLSRGRVIRAEFPTEPLMVECDQEQIETVIVNLVENALKYSPDGTPLEIEGRAEGSAVVFSIRDGGPGLEAGEEERVFEKFFRSTRPRRAEGTGLGLAICKAVVEAHGGRIAARNREGGGAEFWFSLPALQGALELRDA